MRVDVNGIPPIADFYVDFIDGDGPSNFFTMHSFSTDGILTLKEITGTATPYQNGYLISDEEFFSGMAFSLAQATSLSFLISFSNHPPANDSFMDSINAFVYQSESFDPLVFTNDPLGSNSIFNWLATGTDNGSLLVFESLVSTSLHWNVSFIDSEGSASLVDEPNSWILLALAMCILFCFRKNFQEI